MLPETEGDEVPEPLEKLTRDEYLRVLRLGLSAQAAQVAADIEVAKLPKTILSAEQVETVFAAGSEKDQLNLLTDLLDLEGDPQTNIRLGIQAEFFYYHYKFCKDTGFGGLKTAIFLTVMSNTLEKAKATDWPSRAKVFEIVKAGVIAHCTANAGDNYEGFSIADTKLLTKYIARTFFRYYNAYKYVYTKDRMEEDITRDVFVEAPLPPHVPLDSA